jgi:hypothetical protein
VGGWVWLLLVVHCFNQIDNFFNQAAKILKNDNSAKNLKPMLNNFSDEINFMLCFKITGTKDWKIKILDFFDKQGCEFSAKQIKN